MKPLLRFALLASLFALPLPAQTVPGGSIQRLDSPWDPAGAGAFGSVATGDFDADGYPDLAQLRGGGLEVMLAPASLGEVYSGRAADAVAVVPAGSDRILIADGSGLAWLDFDGTLWSETSAGFSAAWAGAVELFYRAGPGGAVQVIGLAADRRSLLSIADEGGGMVERADPLIVAPEALLGVIPFDRDGDGVSELLLLDSNGMRVAEVVDPSAGPQAETWTISDSWQFSGYSMRDAAAGRQGAGPRQWAAVLCLRPDGTTPLIVTVTSNGLSAEPAVLPAGLEPERLAGGDYDGDGADDLALSWRSTQEVGLLPNTGGETPSFDPSALVRLALSETPNEAAPGQVAAPLLVDVDRDGDEDIFLSCQATGQLVTRMSQVEEASDRSPSSYRAGSPPILEVGDAQGTATADIDLYPPTRWPAGTPPLVDLEVVVWVQLKGSTLLTRLGRDITPGIDTSSSDPIPLSLRLAPGETLDANHLFTQADYYFYRTRFVQYDASGQVVYSTPHQTHAYHAQGDPAAEGPGQAAHQQLLQWGGVSPFQVQYFENSNGDDYVTVGEGVIVPKIPPPPVGELGSN